MLGLWGVALHNAMTALEVVCGGAMNSSTIELACACFVLSGTLSVVQVGTVTVRSAYKRLQQKPLGIDAVALVL
eukprot:4089586-Amphidinium_carterae.1